MSSPDSKTGPSPLSAEEVNLFSRDLRYSKVVGYTFAPNGMFSLTDRYNDSGHRLSSTHWWSNELRNP